MLLFAYTSYMPLDNDPIISTTVENKIIPQVIVQKLDEGWQVLEGSRRLGKKEKDIPLTADQRAGAYLLQAAERPGYVDIFKGANLKQKLRLLMGGLDPDGYHEVEAEVERETIANRLKGEAKTAFQQRIATEQGEYQKSFEKLFPVTEFPPGYKPEGAIVFLNALGTNREFKEEVDALEKSGVRSVNIDVPPFGSPIEGVNGQVFDMDNMARYVIYQITKLREETRDENGVSPYDKPLNMVGHSLGGLLTAKMAEIMEKDGITGITFNSVVTMSSPFSANWEKATIPPLFKATKLAVETPIGDTANKLKDSRLGKFLVKLFAGDWNDFVASANIKGICLCYSQLMNDINWDDTLRSIDKMGIPMVAFSGSIDGALRGGSGYLGTNVVDKCVEITRSGYGHARMNHEDLMRTVVSTVLRADLAKQEIASQSNVVEK